MRNGDIEITLDEIVAQAPAPSGQAAPPGQETPTLRVQVNEVIVPVTVTDEKDRFVSNLDVNDFKIFDDGREQKIVYFSRERNQPVVVGFLLDMSNASRLHWQKTIRRSQAGRRAAASPWPRPPSCW